MEIGEATYHRWRNQHGGMKAEEAKRLKELEQENARLKKMVADLMLEKEKKNSVIGQSGKTWRKLRWPENDPCLRKQLLSS